MLDEYEIKTKGLPYSFEYTSKNIKAWTQAGAFIFLLGSKPVTRLDDLWYWLLENRDKIGDMAPYVGMSTSEAKKQFSEDGKHTLLGVILSGQQIKK